MQQETSSKPHIVHRCMLLFADRNYWGSSAALASGSHQVALVNTFWIFLVSLAISCGCARLRLVSSQSREGYLHPYDDLGHDWPAKDYCWQPWTQVQ